MIRIRDNYQSTCLPCCAGSPSFRGNSITLLVVQALISVCYGKHIKLLKHHFYWPIAREELLEER